MHANLFSYGILVSFLAIFSISSGAFAKDIAPPSVVINGIDLLPSTEHINENCAKSPLSLKDILSLDQSSYAFVSKSKGKNFSFGYSQCEHWFRWRLSDFPIKAGSWWLQIQPTFLDWVDLYIPNGDGSYRVEHLGDHIPRIERSMASRHFLVPLLVTDDTHAYYYLRVKTSSTLTLGLMLWQPEAYFHSLTNENIFYGILFGLTFTAIFLCCIAGIWIRDPFYFVMAAFLFFNGMMQWTVNGFDQLWFYSQSSNWPDRILTFSVYCGSVAGISLYLVFLRAKKYYPRYSAFCWGIAIASGVAAALSLLGYPFPLISGFGSLFVLSNTLILTLIMFRHRFVPAVLMLTLFAPQVLTLSLQMARNFSLLPMTFWTTHLWAITSMLQIPFIALVVMLRLRAQEKLYVNEQEKTRMHRDLFTMVAHELRTPLAVVSSGIANIELQTLAERTELAPRFRRVNLGLARLTNLIDNALAEDRLLDQGIELQCEWLTLEQLVEQVKELRPVEAPHRLSFDINHEQTQVFADPHWMGLAILNLLDNAIKYSPEGGDIQITVGRENDMAAIQVADEGIGIPQEAGNNIFKKFFRADNARAVSGASGMGLGLFLVQTVVNLHKGKINCRSNPAGGTIFTLCFYPCAKWCGRRQ